MDDLFTNRKRIGDRYSDISLLIETSRPKGYEEYYEIREPLLGKEPSLGSIDKTDMLANDLISWAILELLFEGQTDFAWDYMTWYQNDWISTRSIDGKLLDRLTSEEIRYTQTQHVHEHPPEPSIKKGFLGRQKR